MFLQKSELASSTLRHRFQFKAVGWRRMQKLWLERRYRADGDFRGRPCTLRGLAFVLAQYVVAAFELARQEFPQEEQASVACLGATWGRERRI